MKLVNKGALEQQHLKEKAAWEEQQLELANKLMGNKLNGRIKDDRVLREEPVKMVENLPLREEEANMRKGHKGVFLDINYETGRFEMTDAFANRVYVSNMFDNLLETIITNCLTSFSDVDQVIIK